MTLKQKTNRARNIAAKIIKSGMNFLQRTVDLDPAIYTYKDLDKFFKTQELKSYSFSDLKYRVAHWSKLKEIISVDWTDSYKYYHDYFDCDDFSFAFASRMAEYYRLNTMGVAYGAVYDKQGKKRWGHAFNLILALNDNSELQLYLFEPQTDEWTEYKPGKKLWLKSGEYRINWLLYF